MAADALAPYVTRTSAVMILIMQNRKVLVLLKEEFQSTTWVLLVWRNDIKCKYMFMFPLKHLARKVLIVKPTSQPSTMT